MKTFWQQETDIIDPHTEMHYAILSSFQNTNFPHSHDFFEFFLIVEGSQELVCNHYTMTLGPGALVLIRPNDIHTRRYIQSGYHINIAFSSVIAKALFEYLGSGYPSESLLSPGTPPPYVMLNQMESERVERRMKELYTISLTDLNLQRTKLRTLILDIFVYYFSRCFSRQQSGEGWFENLLQEMEKPANLSEGLPALLRISKKSHEYLCRIFRQYRNLTPTQYINDLRLNYAANFLIHSDLPILDICMMTGFDNLSHFYHLFRKKYDMTPRQFRNTAHRSDLFADIRQ